MKTLLTAPDIEYLRGQQMKLDGEIIRNNSITHDEWMEEYTAKHYLALSVEFGEFANATFDIWKYWKKKPIDREKIIDEAVDVIHFAMLIYNKLAIESEEILLSWKDYKEYHDGQEWNLEERLGNGFSESTHSKMAIVLYVLDHYNFTSKDIIEAYNRKNKINFERMESGY